jgi:hypothetical protein
VLLATLARAAHADEESQVQVGSWGAAGLELSTAGYASLRFTETVGDNFALNLTPALIGGAAAFAAYYWDLDPTPALAIHGAVWTGVDLMLVGALIDGHDDNDLAFGTWAKILGAVGAVGGGVLGATVGDRVPQAWMVAPTAGAAGGVLIGGLWVLLSGDIGGDHSVQQLSIGVAGGVAVGIATAAILGATTEEVAATPRVSHDRDRTLVTLGGTF